MPKPTTSKTIKTLLLAGISLGVLTSVSVKAAEDKAFSDTQKSQIEEIFKNYLMENPEIITEAMTELRMKQEREAQEMAKTKIEEYKDDFRSDRFPYAGDKDGEVMVVEFYDYNCGYCKRALPDIQAVLEQEDNVRVVFIDMPILGPSSLSASQWALAAKNQGKYFEYHVALMEHKGAKNEETLTNIAENLGLDVEQMKKDAASQAVQDQINENVTIAREMGVQGTPAFIVGDQLFRGYIGEDALLQSVQEAREEG
ncbi:MAG: DsbA family protein [Alphaproteobacteria bacterium]